MGIGGQLYYSNTTRTAILLFTEGKVVMSSGQLPSAPGEASWENEEAVCNQWEMG
jgi:TATA-box binding protein (TBP) (component of TFIID and TFIIIB)